MSQKKLKNNLNQNLPRILKVAENRKSCPKSQKLRKVAEQLVAEPIAWTLS